MSKILKGTAVTYGTKTGGGVIQVQVREGSTIRFSGEMYASEIRLSYEGDTATATDNQGEVVSVVGFNHRKVLNLTGIVLATSQTPNAAGVESVATADAAFSAPFSVGCDLWISYGGGSEWEEVDKSGNLGWISTNNPTGNHSTGYGDFHITSAEKTRSSAKFAEWTLTAVEHIPIDYDGAGSADNSDN